MELEELYQKIGGDLKNVMKRIPNEAMIGKFVRKYANDPTYNRLTAAVEAKNWKDAFLAAHTLKGVAQNLGFGDNVGRFMIIGLVGVNFLAELGINIVLSPVILRLIRIGRKEN